MSKEKELLRRVRDTLHALKETPYDLYWDIQTALDQPEQDNIQYLLDQVARLTAENTMLKEKWASPKREQTEQEPVAWMYDLDMMIHPISNTRSLRFGELTSISLADRPLQDAVNIRPLYLAPPTREPFGPEERQRLSKAYSTRAEQVAFEEGIIFAEISYGIGGE